MPSVALRGVVIFPGCQASFIVQRPASVKAIETAASHDGLLFLVPQLDVMYDEPSGDELATIGVTAKLLQKVKLDDGCYQVLFEGIERAQRVSDQYTDGILACFVYTNRSKKIKEGQNMTCCNTLRGVYQTYLQKSGSLAAPDLLEAAGNITDISKLCDRIVSDVYQSFSDRLTFLQQKDPVSRYEMLLERLKSDLEVIVFNDELEGRTKSSAFKRQREAYLREQLAVIHAELGDDGSNEYIERIYNTALPDYVERALTEEAHKLDRMPFGSPETTVIRNYLDECLALPWMRYTHDSDDIMHAEMVLNADHEGLEDVKKRIVEFIAVRQFNPDIKGQILLLVGPPGVGKTSIARSVATATGRKFARVSLGGVHDESEIRGHRRTYVGSMPGRIIDAIKHAGSANPVLLLDELDKMTSDIHGDPTSAMLEVLDPEQNVKFRDNFIELPFDLSKCLFIATANTTDRIPAALLDRMEVIQINSYTDFEKFSIAKKHLIPKQIKRHGLKKSQIKFSDDAIYAVMHGYTRESGVRNLEREIASLCRKAVKELIEGPYNSVSISKNAVERMLGLPKFKPDHIYSADEVGVVNGLAWTSVGGVMLRVETLSMPGTGKIELTGSLGDVMKESAEAAVSYVRKHSKELGIDPQFYKDTDLHIHVPEGATPKDGPSAGVTICTSIISELTGKPVLRDVAMTGEITLTGRVLPIGGLREKSIAAYKAGAKKVIVPVDNMPEIQEFDSALRESLEFIPAERISDVLSHALS